jgi:hypothetical protein
MEWSERMILGMEDGAGGGRIVKHAGKTVLKLMIGLEKVDWFKR